MIERNATGHHQAKPLPSPLDLLHLLPLCCCYDGFAVELVELGLVHWWSAKVGKKAAAVMVGALAWVEVAFGAAGRT